MIKVLEYIIYVYLGLGLAFGHNFQAKAQENLDSASERYMNCVTLAQSSPDLGLAIAESWLNSGGGLPAHHCIALALANNGFYQESALELEKIIKELQVGGSEESLSILTGDSLTLKADLYGQAGNIWLLANQPSEAFDAFSKGLQVASEGPSRLELLIDRSRTLALMEDYDAALIDLDTAQLIAPDRADIFVYKASAKRFLKQYDGANSDVELALFRDPENREGLLERGNLRRIKGNIKGAIEDWEYLIALYPESFSAEVAQKNLDNLKAEEALSFPDDKN